MINAPSLANCSLLELGDQVAELVRAGIQVFHLDIMDGHYVPNLGLPLSVVSDIKRKYPAAVADVHLMVEAPESYVARLGALGADQVSFPSDGTKFAVRTATAIREAGMKPGVVVNPSQPVDIVAPYLGLLDQVVLMTVEPGVHGQVALDGCLERWEEVVRLRDRLLGAAGADRNRRRGRHSDGPGSPVAGRRRAGHRQPRDLPAARWHRRGGREVHERSPRRVRRPLAGPGGSGRRVSHDGGRKIARSGRRVAASKTSRPSDGGAGCEDLPSLGRPRPCPRPLRGDPCAGYGQVSAARRRGR
ncbi:MAG: ribulose-phosphate 3-epimerase [Propionibacteriaceae bacterium]|nr:ribulose-phosphate 3-epimerase [Propionibacteriaceae bacterium]